MEDKNCDELFEYLRSILYDPKVKPLDMESLDEPYQKLGMGLQFLEKAVKEMKEYSAALSKGKLSAKMPGRDNFLCENLKNMHANLNHLTWQAKQVAKGDYTQTVSFLGEFSEAFNTMTSQLQEREYILKKEAETEKLHAEMTESYNQLLLELIARSDEEILVISMEDSSVLYRNENAGIWMSPEEIYQLCLNQQESKYKEGVLQKDSYEWNWEAKGSGNHYYRITTGIMVWQGQKAYAHIIREITAEKEREARLKSEALQDHLTGIGNRHYFQEKTRELLASGKRCVFCYCDLDHLKDINDTYGHNEGDWYIRCFADIVRFNIREEDLFARIGGDEFCIILSNCTREKAERKLKKMQRMFGCEKAHSYGKSFSFGLVELPENHAPVSVETVLCQADMFMYQQKRGKNGTKIPQNAACSLQE